jgi:cyanophycinase-like exopeptidase
MHLYLSHDTKLMTMRFFSRTSIQLLIFLLIFPALLSAQGYVSYFTGDTTDVVTPTSGGSVLMGGATENDNAMRWFLERAHGGDVVVIRASGSDGYNDYLYSQLGIPVNSVQTLLMPNFASAQEMYVAQQIRNAEALWMAGGDQWRYVSYWKDGPVGDALRYLIDVKKAVIGGTSAGMAVLGEAYFSAQNGTVTSQEALNNPYGSRVAVGYNDFLHVPFLDNLVTDTHYDDPDRRGRQVTFIARLATDHQQRFFGIASEEYTAVCIDTTGLARVFGKHPQSQDFAYFLQTTCENDYLPENCTAGMPLNWRRNNQAVAVCKVPGENDGSLTFSLTDWKTTNGGTWENWWVESGILKTAPAAGAPACLTGTDERRGLQFQLFPNPAGAYCDLVLPDQLQHATAALHDAQGQLLHTMALTGGTNSLDLQAFAAGVYFVKIQAAQGAAVARLCRL